MGEIENENRKREREREQENRKIERGKKSVFFKFDIILRARIK